MAKSKKRRPYWQQQPCPEWCDVGHRKFDGGTDRDCISSWSGKVTFTLMDPRRNNLGPEYGGVVHDKAGTEIYLQRPFGAAEPHVVVAHETESGGIGYLKLTAGEALKLAKILTTAVDVAEGHCNPGGAR